MGMAETEKTIADQRSDQAFANGPFLDPRGAFRERLKVLREEQPAAFKAALEYYEKTLIPNMAGGADPIVEWVAYGRRLGELTGPGQSWAIDPTGRARPFAGEFDAGQLILHLPEDTSRPALAIALPREPSAAQQATYDLLIQRARALAS